MTSLTRGGFGMDDLQLPIHLQVDTAPSRRETFVHLRAARGRAAAHGGEYRWVSGTRGTYPSGVPIGFEIESVAHPPAAPPERHHPRTKPLSRIGLVPVYGQMTLSRSVNEIVRPSTRTTDTTQLPPTADRRPSEPDAATPTVRPSCRTQRDDATLRMGTGPRMCPDWLSADRVAAST
ncbi:MAG: hypothetical protein HOU01_00600 [Streptomycetaceae bacterium]|nr:hypothetical protein [Streptomycetaceae bacterium]